MTTLEPIQLPANSFKIAAESNFPTLVANLNRGSEWLELINAEDDPTRNNSPYYGPATQFMVDCFFDIADRNPSLQAEHPTPLTRYKTAEFVIGQYIGGFCVGPEGLLAKTYRATDVAETAAHANRSINWGFSIEHVLLGATVPFDDMARVCGGAALMLHQEHDLPVSDMPEVVKASRSLQIIAGIAGQRTPELTNALGGNYILPEHFELNDDGTVHFTSHALETVRSLLSGIGCPTAKIAAGEGKLFDVYWKRIVDYLLTDVKIKPMLLEAKATTELRRMKHTPQIPLPTTLQPVKVESRKPTKPHPKASKRYTPPKQK